MRTTKIRNKQGEELTTKEGVPLVENKLEEGDKFIPIYNNISERVYEYLDSEGKTKKAIKYSIKAIVRDKDGKDHGEVYISLTPGQAKVLQNRVDEGVELNQNMFVAHQYIHPKWGEQIGIGRVGNTKPHKKFEDFETKE